MHRSVVILLLKEDSRHILSRSSWQSSPRVGTLREMATTGGEEDGDMADLLKEIFLENELSAKKVHKLAQRAFREGLSACGTLEKAGTHGKHAQNLARDLMRKCLKTSDFPCGPYWAKVPVKNRRTKTVTEVSLPFLLPHEVFDDVSTRLGERMKEFVPGQDGVFASIHSKLRSVAEELHVPLDRLVPIGVHGDGVPFKAKMKDSLEQVSWNLCGAQSAARFLFVALPASAVAGRATWDRIWDVFAWSMRCCLMGSYPSRRHDKMEWQKSDRHRRAKANQTFDRIACCVQARGDWAFYAKVFLLSSWSEGNICWKCDARKRRGPDSFHDCSSYATWRSRRREANSYLDDQVAAGGEPSHFFSIPNMQVQDIMIDWLHTMDLGVSQDIIGNVFWQVLPKLEGRTQDDKVRSLWLRMQAFYRDNDTKSRLDNLSRGMIKNGSDPPKLRSKAAECRYLVPFAAQLASEFAADVQGETTKQVCRLLQDLYEFTKMDRFPAWRAAVASRRMCILLSVLEEEAVARGSTCWRMKPKVHLCQELLEYQTLNNVSPKLCWTYRDEDWGGWLSNCAQRRGGHATPESVGLQVIRRFLAFFKIASVQEEKTSDEAGTYV